MKNYLVSLIKKALEVKHQDKHYYSALGVLIDECTHYEKQFNQFNRENEEEIDEAISMLCCLPLVLELYSNSDRKKLNEAIRMQVSEFAEVIIFNRQLKCISVKRY
jgi:hypothetical protein